MSHQVLDACQIITHFMPHGSTSIVCFVQRFQLSPELSVVITETLTEINCTSRMDAPKTYFVTMYPCKVLTAVSSD